VHTAEEKARRREKEAIDPSIEPSQVKVVSLIGAFTKNARSNNQPMLVDPADQRLLNSIVRGKEGKRASELIQRQPRGDPMTYHYDAKDAAYAKAELIRMNLLSRKDLMQLYRPPMKRSQVAKNNPFIAKSLVDRTSTGFTNRDIQSAIVRVSNPGQTGKLDGGIMMPPIPDPYTANSQANLRNLIGLEPGTRN
jgi:hypothetical protein